MGTRQSNRTRAAIAALGFLALAFGVSDSRAQATGERPAGAVRILKTLERHGDLTLREATLESALFTISELWGINIVAGDVSGSVNGVFKDAPLREILDSILLSNGYGYRPVGGSLVVSPMEQLGQINPFFTTETIPVGASKVDEVMEAARLMSTPQGQVRALPSARALLVVDFPDRVEKIRELVAQIDRATRRLASAGPTGVGPRQLEVAYFRTHFVPALQAATAIDVVLSADGRIASVENDDRLLVVDYPEHVRMVEAVLSRLDRPRPQVNIKSLIYDISLSDLEQIGINWDALSSGVVNADGTPSSGNGALVNSVTKAPFEAGASGGSFTFFSMHNDFNIQAIILALQQAEDSRLLADPNVTVMDNESAAIESVSEIPFQQLTQTTGGGNIGTTAFKEVGIKLDVVPKISRDGSIDMTVVPEFSRLAGFTPGDNQPIVETRRATTRVRVQNGQTLMIAGLRQRSDVGDFDGVPLLKDIRFVGHLFRSRDTQITESELVVFITPEVVGYSDPMGQRERLAADTVGCRLDYIPAAEGCPGCGSPGPCACESRGIIDTTILPGELSSPQPAQEHRVLPSPGESQGPREITPIPAELPAPQASQEPKSAGLNYPKLAKHTARRLPDPNEERPVMQVAARSGSTAGIEKPEQPLRVGYGSRFRAKGELAPATEGEPEKTPEPKRTLNDWLFWR
ncbi:Type II secretion system protein D precursor [Planctomycetes bacterium MalM25]|nr:Type II secretion system protein D precursor [Planctomycetes bacterium MalM25]